MSATILDGKTIREKILDQLKIKVAKLDFKPTLAIILIGEDPASGVYVREKEKAAASIGIDFQLVKKPGNVKQNELEEIIGNLNQDKKVKGIVVQKPLPAHIDDEKIDLLVAPEKDVDGLHPASRFYPTTAQGVSRLLKENDIFISGKKAVVVGRSKLSGLPIALLLLEEDATVTICHSKTANLREETRQADILVSATGVPNLIGTDMVKKGAAVVDVGTNRTREGKLVGDVDFENVKNVVGYISPVPGGVGPMIVAGLMTNLVEAAEK